MRDHIVHTLTGPDASPICGEADTGPIPFGEPIRVIPCPKCMDFGGQGIPHELTMRHHLTLVREQLRVKLRGMSEGDRAAWKEQVVAVAAASLQDPEEAPALYEERQLFAALYAIGAVRAGFFHLRRAGIRPTWAFLEQGLVETEMLTVALVEGTPL